MMKIYNKRNIGDYFFNKIFAEKLFLLSKYNKQRYLDDCCVLFDKKNGIRKNGIFQKKNPKNKLISILYKC